METAGSQAIFRTEASTQCDSGTALSQVIASHCSPLSPYMGGGERISGMTSCGSRTGRQGRLRAAASRLRGRTYAPPRRNPAPRGADRPCRVGAQCNYEGAARSIDLARSAKNTKGGMHF